MTPPSAKDPQGKPPSEAKPKAVLSFDALYDAYGKRVLNLAYRMTGSEDTATDLAQDIWLKVYENLDEFKGKSHVFTWIYRIATNHILNHLKKERRVRWLELFDKTIGEAVREDAAGNDAPQYAAPFRQDRALETDERARSVWRAIQTLDPKYRVPLVLHYYEEMSYNEVAESMGLSMAAVEARIHRAKKQLVKKLGPLLKDL